MSLGRASNLPGPWCGGRGSWVGRIWLTSQWKWQTLECRKSYHTSQCLRLGGATVREPRSLWIRSGRIFSKEQRYFWGFTCSLSLAAWLDEIPITQLQSDLNHSKKNQLCAGLWWEYHLCYSKYLKLCSALCLLTHENLQRTTNRLFTLGIWKKNGKTGIHAFSEIFLVHS